MDYRNFKNALVGIIRAHTGGSVRKANKVGMGSLFAPGEIMLFKELDRKDPELADRSYKIFLRLYDEAFDRGVSISRKDIWELLKDGMRDPEFADEVSEVVKDLFDFVKNKSDRGLEWYMNAAEEQARRDGIVPEDEYEDEFEDEFEDDYEDEGEFEDEWDEDEDEYR